MAPRPLAPPLINVGFDATALLGRRTGVGVFADEVLRGLSALPTLRIQAYALTWRGRQPLESVLPVGVGLARLRLPARALRVLWRHGIDFPYAELICGQIDVVHGPNFGNDSIHSFWRILKLF